MPDRTRGPHRMERSSLLRDLNGFLADGRTGLKFDRLGELIETVLLREPGIAVSDSLQLINHGMSFERSDPNFTWFFVPRSF